MAVALTDKSKELLDGRSFATIATIQPDGSPQLSVVWIKRDGDELLVSTVEGRRKHLNLVKDNRATVLINPPETPYTYIEFRGVASLSTDGGRELIDELSVKYTGSEYGNDGPDDVRVVVRITATKIIGQG
jgi:PPOX class probable F420-dependent enzyme